MRIANTVAWFMAGMISLSGRLAMAEQAVAGRPVNGGTGFQRAVTEVAHDMHWLDDFILYIISAISILVVVLLLVVIVRFNHRANPKPASFTHNSVLEVVWTAVPVVILITLAIPSLRLLFLQLDVPEPDLTLKATGNQWYWSYEYPDQQISFDAVMLQRDELEDAGYTQEDYLLATDTKVVVPVNAIVHVLVTGADVIHSWTVPSFGSKIDGIPGRMNETWFRADETGTFFGQCSELCGKDHAYMPIVVQVVTQEEFDAWVKQTQQAQGGEAPTKLAAVAQ